MRVCRPLCLAICMSSLVALGACSGAPDSTPADGNGSMAASEAAADAPPVAREINEALVPEQVSVSLSLAGEPVYLEDEDALLLGITIANNGQTDLIGSGSKPVNLGASLLGPHGANTPPGIRDFVRVPLPLIARGTEKTVRMKLPAKSLNGQTVQVQLVQEGVAWFNAFGQAPLKLDAYSPCNNASGALCNSSGEAVSAANGSVEPALQEQQ